jgi:2,4-dienoyl-CoA reductase-like NADH-dependent reductase (Old Yellow Enzyme family)
VCSSDLGRFALGVGTGWLREEFEMVGADFASRGSRLDEPHALLDAFPGWGIRLLCTTAGSPYYNPHIQRPTYFPPSDGYLPPEDPLCGVARQVQVTAELKRAHPEIVIVGSGYSYLQDWLGHFAQRAVRDGAVDVVGLGRMALSYPTLPADLLAGRPLARERICRTFSDCTTAPRHGMVSGCYPIDEFYKERPEAIQLKQVKAALRER